MTASDWRLSGWDWGLYDPPYLRAEFRDGHEETLNIETFPDYDEGMEFTAPDELPPSWELLIDESCDDAEAALGPCDDEEGWLWGEGEAPTRWHPFAEWQALKDEAARGGLPNAWMYQDE
jgi:hypothetical protein